MISDEMDCKKRESYKKIKMEAEKELDVLESTKSI